MEPTKAKAPQQLALAILVDYLGDGERAIKLFRAVYENAVRRQSSTMTGR